MMQVQCEHSGSPSEAMRQLLVPLPTASYLTLDRAMDLMRHKNATAGGYARELNAVSHDG
jgi:hypothetical protein